jgi:hypothetical protein
MTRPSTVNLDIFIKVKQKSGHKNSLVTLPKYSRFIYWTPRELAAALLTSRKMEPR